MFDLRKAGECNGADEANGDQVHVGWLDGRPRSVVLDDQRVPVLSIAQICDELAAYPADRGPRRIFDVTTPQARVRLSFERRRRRWTRRRSKPP